MAEGALKIYDADVSVSVTGIAGPDGGSELKPVGTVWFGTALKKTNKKSQAFMIKFSGNRNDIRNSAVNFALNKILQNIKEDS